jgi:hypothetical protein
MAVAVWWRHVCPLHPGDLLNRKKGLDYRTRVDVTAQIT